MDGTNRSAIKIGQKVKIVLKKDQATGKLTKGIVQNILTNSSYHPHGIKVRLTDSRVGRVKEICQ
ncbi:MAG: YwbE family protein [Spirochaetes bacterium]|nr:YwbE family protein [Spirochaetota bacterium]